MPHGMALHRIAKGIVILFASINACMAQTSQTSQTPAAQPDEDTAVKRASEQTQPPAEEKSAGILPDVTVIGSSLATDLLVYPGSVTIINDEQLEKYNTPIEALAHTPGVAIGDDFGRGSGQQFNVRGFGYQSEDRVIILQDGVRRSATMFSNHISTFRSDNDLLKRIEVVKGASSSQYGGGAIGGVISMAMKEASDFIPTGQDSGVAAKLRYEHNNYREGYVAGAMAPVDKPYEFLVYGKKGKRGDITQSDVFGENAQGQGIKKSDNDENLRVFFLQGGIKPTPDQKISLSYYDYKQDQSSTWQTLWHPSFSTVSGPVIGTIKQQDWVAKYNWQPADNPWINVSGQLYHSKASFDRGYDYFDQRDQEEVRLDYANTDKRTGFRLSNEAHFETGAVAHRFITGLDYEKRNEDADYVLNDAKSDFGSMPNTYKDFGIYGNLESSFLGDRVVVLLGGRFDRFDRSVANKDSKYNNSNFSPRLGASWQVFNGFHLLGNYSEAFRAPTPHETSAQGALNPHYWYLPNPDLKAETVREKEFGFSYARANTLLESDSIATKFMFFDGKIKDMIALETVKRDELSPQGSPYATYGNVNRVKRHGFEWTLSYSLPKVTTNFGFSRVRQRDAKTGVNTPYTLADKLSVNLQVRPVHGLRLGLDVNHWLKPKHNPESRVIRGERLWYIDQAFTVVDFNGAWRPTPHANALIARELEFQFGIKNLFNARYASANNYTSSRTQGKGRNVYVGATSRF